MQNLHMQRNCRRFSAQVGQQMNCTQKIQRVRCCGRVHSAQENDSALLENNQDRGRGCGQGRENNRGKGQGRGQCMTNNQA